MTNVPFALVAPANVLEDEDVAVLGELLVGAGDLAFGVADAVRRALEQKRQRLRRVARAEDLDVQL